MTDSNASADEGYGDAPVAPDVDDTDAATAPVDAPDLSADVVPTAGNLMPNGLPLLPGVGPALAGPNDPVEE